MNRAQPFWRALRIWRDAKALNRGPSAYGARLIRRRAHRWVNRRIR